MGVGERVVDGVAQAGGHLAGQELRHEEALLFRSLQGGLPGQVHVQVGQGGEEEVGDSGVGDEALVAPQVAEGVLGDEGGAAGDGGRGVHEAQEDVGEPPDVQDDDVVRQLGEAAGDGPLRAAARGAVRGGREEGGREGGAPASSGGNFLGDTSGVPIAGGGRQKRELHETCWATRSPTSQSWRSNPHRKARSRTSAAGRKGCRISRRRRGSSRYGGRNRSCACSSCAGG